MSRPTSPTTDVQVATTVSEHQILDWRGHRFEVVEVTRLAPGYFQCLLAYVDEPERLPISVPASDLDEAKPVTDAES